MSKLQTPPENYSQGWLEQLDGRTSIAQEMSERYQAFTSDLGGIDRLSYAQRSLVARSLWLEHWLCNQEKELATGDTEFDVGRYTQGVNSLQGIFSKLGLKRQAREVSLKDVIKQAKK